MIRISIFLVSLMLLAPGSAYARSQCDLVMDGKIQSLIHASSAEQIEFLNTTDPTNLAEEDESDAISLGEAFRALSQALTNEFLKDPTMNHAIGLSGRVSHLASSQKMRIPDHAFRAQLLELARSVDDFAFAHVKK